jgi:hypothetical protein
MLLTTPISQSRRERRGDVLGTLLGLNSDDPGSSSCPPISERVLQLQAKPEPGPSYPNL